ncbi:MAG: trimeric intracellular cation channel family protein [Vicingaceae bacterium]
MEVIIPANINDILHLLDLIGTLVFAISGAMAASSKKLDLFGAAFIGFVTAVGGGTIRDLLIGDTPVGWMQNVDYLFIILAGVGITFLFRSYVKRLRKTLFLFDTIGIGVFTTLGLKKALLFGVEPPIAIMMGMFSATLGGVIRDTLINEIPLVFRKELYALACLIGGTLFVYLQMFGLNFEINTIITISTIIVIRIIAIRFKIGLSGIDDGAKFPFRKS